MDQRIRQRVALSTFFFLSGICFATWASRIPTIKETFQLNEAELGTILLFMPLSSLIGLPISGWLVARFDSRIPLQYAFISLSLAMLCIGFAPTILTLILAQCLFAFSMRLLNIAMNTQAITLQKQFIKNINGSFHGLWSTGGIAGVGFSTLLVSQQISMGIHLSIVAAITLLTTIFTQAHLLRNDRALSGNKISVRKPDPYLVCLGLLVFCAAICEGGMFDWSGIYFKEVVGAEIFTVGYLMFMICMACSRFASDYLIEGFGIRKLFTFSCTLIVCGIGLAIVFPGFWTALIGFCLTGFGTAFIFPLALQLAGKSVKYSAGIAISIVATYSIVGAFIGPPLVGYLAHTFGLRYAFITFAIAGFMFYPISRLVFHYQRMNV